MKLQTILRRYSVEQLQQAIRYSRTQIKRDKLEAERDSLRKQLAKVERKIAALESASGNGAAATATKPGRKRGYTLSPETRGRMAEAAKRRHAGKSKNEVPALGKRKRKPMSPESRAKMAAAARARWAKVKGTVEPKAETKV